MDSQNTSYLIEYDPCNKSFPEKGWVENQILPTSISIGCFPNIVQYGYHCPTSVVES